MDTLYWLGVLPVYFKKTWLKYWLEENPAARAMSVTDCFLSANISWAF